MQQNPWYVLAEILAILSGTWIFTAAFFLAAGAFQGGVPDDILGFIILIFFYSLGVLFAVLSIYYWHKGYKLDRGKNG